MVLKIADDSPNLSQTSCQNIPAIQYTKWNGVIPHKDTY